MFEAFMINTWIAASVVAVVAGVVGFFVVLRGASFLAHAIPHGAFAGAAGAVLVGLDPLLGMGVFAAGAAMMITVLGRKGRVDVVIALALSAMLGIGALFLSLSTEYSAEVFSFLFGQILGVSSLELLPMLVLGVVCLIAVGVLFRPLLLSSIAPELGAARGVNAFVMTTAFTLLVALATTMSVPVVGALLMFSLLVGPAAAARAFVTRPLPAIALSVGIALVTVWIAIAAAYESDWPIGFFVTAISAVLFVLARVVTRLDQSRRLRSVAAREPAARSQRTGSSRAASTEPASSVSASE